MTAGKRNPVSSPGKLKIIELHQNGKPIYDIVRILGRSGSVVKCIVVIFKSSGSIENFPRYGRLRKTSHRHDCVFTSMSLQNRFKIAAGISRHLS